MKQSLRKIFYNIENIILFSFLLTFLIAFIYPIFISTDNMQFPVYVPPLWISGDDLYVSVNAYTNNIILPYLPASKYFFLIFGLFSHTVAYRILTLLSITCLIILCIFIIPKISFIKNFFTTAFFLVLILSSYGFQFELERGQWNLFAFFLVFLSLFLFINDKKNFSIIIFCIAVQLKLYPLIFLFLFYDKTISLKLNIIHYSKILFLNIILLFSTGWESLLKYINHMLYYTSYPFCWAGNHSITSFVTEINKKYLTIPSLSYILLALYLLCLISVIIITFKLKIPFYNKYLFFILTVGTLIIPSVSHDYTLPALSLATLYFFLNTEPKFRIGLGLIYTLLLITVFLTLYSYTNYVGRFNLYFLKNKFPLIFFSGIIITILCIKEYIEIFKKKKSFNFPETHTSFLQTTQHPHSDKKNEARS